MPPLSDEVVICTWMEETPWLRPVDYLNKILEGDTVREYRFWKIEGTVWKIEGTEWATIPLTLDALWEVEERLSEEQWEKYLLAFATPAERIKRVLFWERGSALLHADAPTRIKALASVLRPEVEK